MAERVRKGDRVVVVSGRDKGKSGDVLKVFQARNRIIVQGVNMVKRHTRASNTDAGGIVEKEATVHVSNVAHMDPKDDKPTRIGFKFLNDGRKVRYAKRSGEIIDS
jgi:large subunit ribosomal protein L24